MGFISKQLFLSESPNQEKFHTLIEQLIGTQGGVHVILNLIVRWNLPLRYISLVRLNFMDGKSLSY